MSRLLFLVLSISIPIRISLEPCIDFMRPVVYKPIIKTKKKVDFLQKEITCMADNIYYEARDQSQDGQIAVAQVVLNRTHFKFYPKTICGVVYDHAQFSWTLHKPQPKNWKVYKKVVKLARSVLTKHVRSGIIDKNVIYYHANTIDPPKWTMDKVMVAEIGDHLFYAREKTL